MDCTRGDQENAMSPTRRSTRAAAVLGTCLAAAVLAAAAARPAPGLPVVRNARPAGGRVLVLDNCDPTFQGKPAYEDNLTCLAGSGRLVFRVSGFNNCEAIGSNHMVAADPARGHVWVLENVGHRIHKLDRAGKKRLTLSGIHASALAVDPATGNLWVLTSKGTIYGDKTRVFSPAGKPLATYAVSGWDIAHDRKGKAFWIAGPRLAKVDAAGGKVAFVKPISAWCASSVAVDPRTGNAWVTVRRHTQVQGSEDRLLGFDNAGNLRVSVALDGKLPFHVSVDPRRGAVWVTLLRRAVRRYAADGKLQADYPFPALAAEADPAGGAWVVTREETLRVSAKGAVLRRVRHRGPTSQAWIAGY
jgi:DNA-binding beta-propeller fold protein YncE